MSMPVPGEKGTMTLTGCEGHDCAGASAGAASVQTATAVAARVRTIVNLLLGRKSTTLPSGVRQAARRGACDDRQELAARRGIVAEGADHAAGHEPHAGLVHAARGHALVRRF